MQFLSVQLKSHLKLFSNNLNLEHLFPASMLEAIFCFLFACSWVDNGLASRHAIGLSTDNRLAVIPRIGEVCQNGRWQNNCQNVAVCTCLHNIMPRVNSHICALYLNVVAVNPLQVCNLFCGHSMAAQPKNLSHVFFLLIGIKLLRSTLVVDKGLALYIINYTRISLYCQYKL